MSTPKTKLCKKCGKRRSTSKFHKSSSNKDGLQARCMDCNKKHVVEWQKKNPDYWHTQKQRQERIAIQWRMRKYNITEEEAVALLKVTDCEICGKDLEGKGNIDHDHATGKVRGVLCGPCNRGLGIFKDDIALLQKATQYLLTHRPITPL